MNNTINFFSISFQIVQSINYFDLLLRSDVVNSIFRIDKVRIIYDLTRFSNGRTEFGCSSPTKNGIIFEINFNSNKLLAAKLIELLCSLDLIVFGLLFVFLLVVVYDV